MSYFACYAFWNYFTLPALLLDNRIQWADRGNGSIAARFPHQLPTHSSDQSFLFDPQTGLLVKHNYTAEVFSRFARASNRVLSHANNGAGLAFANSRRVTPATVNGHAMHWPSLIDITVHEFGLE